MDPLELFWYGFMLTAFLLATLVVGKCSAATAWPSSPRATMVGLPAALVQFIGLPAGPSSCGRPVRGLLFDLTTSARSGVALRALSWLQRDGVQVLSRVA